MNDGQGTSQVALTKMEEPWNTLTSTSQSSELVPPPSQASSDQTLSNAKIKQPQPKPQRPALHRNQTSFSLTLAGITPAEVPNLNLPTNPSSLGRTLSPSAKFAVKQDIRLVHNVQSEHEQLNFPLEIPTPTLSSTPLLTPRPIPDSKISFLDTVQHELKHIESVKTGLERYLNTIQSGEHTIFSASFLENQRIVTDATFRELTTLRERLSAMASDVKGFPTPYIDHINGGEDAQDYFGSHPWIGTVASPTSRTSHAEERPRRPDTTRETVQNESRLNFSELRTLMARIRGVLVASHVFYKINYALAAGDKQHGSEEIARAIGLCSLGKAAREEE